MNDREKAIKDLEDVIAIADGLKGLPSQYGGIIISLDKIDSLRFGLASIKILDELATRLEAKLLQGKE